MLMSNSEVVVYLFCMGLGVAGYYVATGLETVHTDTNDGGCVIVPMSDVEIDKTDIECYATGSNGSCSNRR